ncbi:MAG TPA: hypothetical protein VMU29_12070 [Smithella sp.]|nr:hypothetical protein [Smithella sp.]
MKASIVVAMDGPYLDKAKNHGLFLSLIKNWNQRICVLLIDCKTSDLIAHEKIQYVFIEKKQLETAGYNWPQNRDSYFSIEGGDFLPFFDFDEHELIIKIDADMIMQAPIRDEFYNNWRFGLVATTESDMKLREEFWRLQPKCGYEAAKKRFPEMKRKKLLNGGVVVAQAKTYEAIWAHYKRLFNVMVGTFGHHAGTQFLLSWIIHTYFHQWNMGYSMHCGDWFIDVRTMSDRGKLYYRFPELVVFNHTKFNPSYDFKKDRF